MTAEPMSVQQQINRPDVARIAAARANNPKMRERDLARHIGISEAELVAADCGTGVVRIEPDISVLFEMLKTMGDIMVLARNDSAVHEKIGGVERFIMGKRAALTLGTDIDTRMFPANWTYGFAVEKQHGEEIRRSLQFFDAHGDAVQKIYARPETDMAKWQQLVESLRHPDQSAGLDEVPEPAAMPAERTVDPTVGTELDRRWRSLTDPHQFHGMLRDLDLHRLSAFELADQDLAWRLDTGTVPAMLRLAAAECLPIMCFVGNRGCIQIHSGPVSNVVEKGPWINVLDPRFHLHLRTDRIAEVWAVRKPADIEHVTSVEAFDADGNQIIQFFGVRQEGGVERSDWRELVEKLPRSPEALELGAAE